MKKKLFICIKEHMDPLWRRCFDRDILYKGQLFVPYSDLEAFYIEDNLKFCKKYPFYRFELESVLVLKKFLEKHPEYEQDIAHFIENGQMHLSFSGNNIIDSNMVQGESIVRNLLNGYQYMKSKYNVHSEGLDRMDAFGNAAQLPQIARGFGSKWVKNISYVPIKAPYWEGIDGSRVYNLEPPCVGTVGSFFKYRPCPVCHGLRDTHCEHCNDRRIDIDYMEQARPRPLVNDAALDKLSVPGYLNVGGEEILPTEEIIDWAQAHANDYDISFATFEDYLPYYQEFLDQVDSSDEVHPSPELNPNSTGCLVSRIKTKQYVRQLENRLMNTETLCALRMLQDRTRKKDAHAFAYPQAQLESIWEKAFLTMFHDSITATHVDAAYEELLDTLQDANSLLSEIQTGCLQLPSAIDSKSVTVFNPTGVTVTACARITVKGKQPVSLTTPNKEKAPLLTHNSCGDDTELTFVVRDLPAFTSRTYSITPADPAASGISEDVNQFDETIHVAVLQNQTNVLDTVQSSQVYTIENEFYTLKASDNGITEIYDKRLGRIVSKESEYMVGEWILEHDEGSPWATLSLDMRRTRLSPDTRLIHVEKNGDVQTLTFRIKPSNIRIAYGLLGIDITYRVSLIRGLDRIQFSADAYWDTFNHRLRIAFPSADNGRHIYEVPYAFLERKPYEPQIMLPNGDAEWNNASGDYPAINWAGIESNAFALALFNQGTPSYQINTDKNGVENIYLSVLRSPSVPTCLHEPNSYSMQEYDGMRDTGTHHFEYALKSYAEAFSENTAVADGIAYNTQLLAITDAPAASLLPVLSGGDVYISAVKLSEDRQGLILRLAEYRGKNTAADITLPDWVKEISETDLKEDILRTFTPSDDTITLAFHRFEIKTLYLKF